MSDERMTLKEAYVIVRIANAGGWPCSSDKEAEARKIVAEARNEESEDVAAIAASEDSAMTGAR